MAVQPVLVWDFDGVLNANVVDGRFIWADRLAQDWGIDRDDMANFIFHPSRIGRIMRGQITLQSAFEAWCTQVGQKIDSVAFLAYWFAQDAHPDLDVVVHLERAGLRHVIGTNNEASRAAYIETEMGFGQLVERVFASGRMGCAKPDGAYFAQIEAWSGAPSRAHALIDDTKKNIDAAQARGWQAYHFTDATRAGLPDFLDSLAAPVEPSGAHSHSVAPQGSQSRRTP